MRDRHGLKRINPFTGEVVTRAAAGGRDDARAAVEAAAGALHDAGLPAGVINLVVHSTEGAPDVVDELIAHPAVRRVNFTGSTRVGRIIAAKCAEHLKPSVLELGGKVGPRCA